ncbi:MAG TPA: hypothetical protein VGC56_08750, partial [Allosphingosinicella sp.]
PHKTTTRLALAMRAAAQTSTGLLRAIEDVRAEVEAAVDETALAADSMSSTIAAIRADTETVAGEIDQLENGFARVDDQLTRFAASASAFLSTFAA